MIYSKSVFRSYRSVKKDGCKKYIFESITGDRGLSEWMGGSFTTELGWRDEQIWCKIIIKIWNHDGFTNKSTIQHKASPVIYNLSILSSKTTHVPTISILAYVIDMLSLQQSSWSSSFLFLVDNFHNSGHYLMKNYFGKNKIVHFYLYIILTHLYEIPTRWTALFAWSRATFIFVA